MRSTFLAVGALLAAVVPLAAASANPDRPLWLRYPAVSPDGDRVAFCSGGQIWVVPTAGGEAIPLTTGLFYSKYPVWSPDGAMIAFASDRFGNEDVFAVPANGGDVRRLTYSSAEDTPHSFSPDGSVVYFSSRRLGDATATFLDGGIHGGQLYAVPSAGGREALVVPTPALFAQPDSGGDRFLYEDIRSPEQQWRKHAVSDATRDVWLFDRVSSDHRKLTDFRGEDRNPVWAPDGKSFLFLSERAGSQNVWGQPLDGSAPAVQITKHEKHPVRFLTAAKDGSLVYYFDGELWHLKAGATEPARIPVRISQSTLLNGEFNVRLNDEATELAISPSGEEYAIVARGEVFTVSVNSGLTRRITNTPVREIKVSFSPDGRALLYAAERDGKWDLFESYIVRDSDKTFSESVEFTERVVIGTDADETQGVYSPDGTRVAYLENRDLLRVVDRGTGKVTSLSGSYPSYSYEDGDVSFVWSPDSRWIAATSGVASWGEVFLIDATGTRPPLNISRSGSPDGMPAFGRDSQVLYWATGRHGLRQADGGVIQQDIYATFLTRAAFEAFASQGTQEAITEDKSWTPDFTGQEHRSVRLTPYSVSIAALAESSNSSDLIVLTYSPESGLASQLLGIKSRTFRPTPSPAPAGSVSAAIDSKGANAFYLTPGAIERRGLAGPESSTLPFDAQAAYNLRGEMAYIFDHCVRFTEVKFYDTKMHGVDWRGYAARYREFLPYITRWQDFADVLGELVGELNASHTRGNYTHPADYGDQTASLGLYFDDAHRDAGLRVAAVLPGGPSDRAASQLKPGAILLTINGIEIAPSMGVDELLNHQAGKKIRVGVRPAGGGSPVEELITPVTMTDVFGLAYGQWVARRKELTRELSGGRLGYIHVPEMSSPAFERASSELFGEYPDAEAVIVDVRFNLGGNLHDQLITMLTGERSGELISNKGVVVGRVPEGRWGRPSVVLANAASYSDGSVFPHFYQANKIGPIIGENVPGTGTAVWWERQLEPNLVYGVPEVGFRDNRLGRWLENLEIKADVLVCNDPKAIAEGRDQQLEAAVKNLLDRLGK